MNRDESCQEAVTILVTAALSGQLHGELLERFRRWNACEPSPLLIAAETLLAVIESEGEWHEATDEALRALQAAVNAARGRA